MNRKALQQVDPHSIKFSQFGWHLTRTSYAPLHWYWPGVGCLSPVYFVWFVRAEKLLLDLDSPVSSAEETHRQHRARLLMMDVAEIFHLKIVCFQLLLIVCVCVCLCLAFCMHEHKNQTIRILLFPCKYSYSERAAYSTHTHNSSAECYCFIIIWVLYRHSM